MSPLPFIPACVFFVRKGATGYVHTGLGTEDLGQEAGGACGPSFPARSLSPGRMAPTASLDSLPPRGDAAWVGRGGWGSSALGLQTLPVAVQEAEGMCGGWALPCGGPASGEAAAVLWTHPRTCGEWLAPRCPGVRPSGQPRPGPKAPLPEAWRVHRKYGEDSAV